LKKYGDSLPALVFELAERQHFLRDRKADEIVPEA